MFNDDGSCYRYFNWKVGKKDGLCVNFLAHDQGIAKGSAEYTGLTWKSGR